MSIQHKTTGGEATAGMVFGLAGAAIALVTVPVLLPLGVLIGFCGGYMGGKRCREDHENALPPDSEHDDFARRCMDAGAKRGSITSRVDTSRHLSPLTNLVFGGLKKETTFQSESPASYLSSSSKTLYDKKPEFGVLNKETTFQSTSPFSGEEMRSVIKELNKPKNLLEYINRQIDETIRNSPYKDD